MGIWVYAAPPAAVILVVISLVLLLIQRRWRRRKAADDLAVSAAEKVQGIPRRLQQVSPHHLDRARSKKNWRNSGLSPAFRWEDHPSLIADALENGWSRFAFTVFASSPAKSVKGLLGACVANDQPGVSIGWETIQGSSDFMQKIQLNPTKKTINSSAFSVIRTALPLPGPNLGNPSFPQEAYLEITVICFNGGEEFSGGEKETKIEGDKVKLIAEDFNAKNSPEPDIVSPIPSERSQRRNNIDELKIDQKIDTISMSVGFSGGGPLQVRVPGSFPGSIGFNSSGSVFLEGIKIFDGSEKSEWKTRDKVVGCGFDPLQRRVFFTVDGKQVHDIISRTGEFTTPLYPTVSANVDVTVVVNLGQCPFKYPPANLFRSSNPCSVRTPETSPALDFEDSKELFSMGRIDSEWWIRRNAAMRSNHNMVNHIRTLEYDQESEGDLFEIALDGVSHR